MSIIIDDMGGHGRAVQVLYETLRDKPLSSNKPSIIMEAVRSSLALMYGDWLNGCTGLFFRAILSAVMFRKRLLLTETVPDLDGTVDDIVGMGLFRYDSDPTH